MQNSQSIVIREIEDCKTHEFEDSLKLIKANLPNGEVCTKEDFVAVLNQKVRDLLMPDNYHLRAGFIDDKLVAASSGYFISDINAGFIHYICVDPNVQSKGTGTIMRKDLLNCFDNDALQFLGKPIEGYLGEVKITNSWLKTLQKRFNILPLDIDYRQPDLGCGEVPLVLYFQPRKGQLISLRPNAVERIVKSIFKNVYEVKDIESNSTFQKIMESIKNKNYIGRKVIL